MSVYFHANFNLNLERLAEVLSYLLEQPELSEEQIGKQFGYRAPFTKRYKSWLKKCGIIENSTKVGLTEYGKVIYKKDSKLKKGPTLWYIHSYLTSSEDIAEAWNYFYHTYLPKNKSFSLCFYDILAKINQGQTMKLFKILFIMLLVDSDNEYFLSSVRSNRM